ncbi:hypothetical protein B0H14DRAFT_2838490 [Mycena olivaceomarginata]|nr:hypothetical protein B0H14DRAFT_2838490 [Mycena olivaceomarginata]
MHPALRARVYFRHAILTVAHHLSDALTEGCRSSVQWLTRTSETAGDIAPCQWASDREGIQLSADPRLSREYLCTTVDSCRGRNIGTGIFR